ncbi:Uma2 family endonuclease [Nostoc flagelliforme FACHB-838]|uniref:Uma2 family endonuclease n=1 Tax=Nostoc flagelliforme FACHB-838 TaxID=2692904 RepID=A0ABR8DP41_9NOSO|nr:Uma2 family endonuclease [Nostoc flagelliforme]MBD2529935.1 Uma2 family endonuclease [Nostoc flagelliforme FACHB-838]
MVLQTEKRYYTPEEYLELEEKAEYKNEYTDGEIIQMTGGTTNHNKIAGNFYKRFPLTLQGQDYEIYIGDVKLSIPRYCLYTYPDVMVIKGKPIYEGTGKTIITNPLLIVEILSNSTKNYDKTDKFKYYRSIPGFQEYIMIDQYSFAVEQFIKQAEGQWIFKEYEGEDAVLVLDSIDFKITLRDIYERVNFELIEE